MTPVLTAQNIHFSRQGRQVLEGVSLQLVPGTIVTLIGPNGAGKSTFVKILLGIEKPDSGQVTRQSGLEVGYMPQKIHVDESMPLTVKKLLCLPHPVSNEEVDTALALTGVSYLRDQQVQKLSGGEFQRVLLARAVVRKPDLLVLDEPVQGVDYTGEIALYEVIHQLRKTLGCAILMVSHDLHIVMAKTDEVICLNRHVCCSGTPESVKDHPEFQQLFGANQAALGLYTHHHNHEHRLDDQGHSHG